jgi:hypothetical protein
LEVKGKKYMKPIETIYRGFRFRSRLEARWAVFYDSLGIAWEYEREGFDFGNGDLYLPDFYIPSLDCWIEIKGEEPTSKESFLADKLAQATRKDVFIFFGQIPLPPDFGDSDSAHVFWRCSDGSAWDNYHAWCQCPVCGKLGIQFSGASNRNCDCVKKIRGDEGGDSGHDLAPDCDRNPLLMRAYQAARQARFEHGEYPR